MAGTSRLIDPSELTAGASRQVCSPGEPAVLAEARDAIRAADAIPVSLAAARVVIPAAVVIRAAAETGIAEPDGLRAEHATRVLQAEARASIPGERPAAACAAQVRDATPV